MPATKFGLATMRVWLDEDSEFGVWNLVGFLVW